jgi:hypothetical protein
MRKSLATLRTAAAHIGRTTSSVHVGRV